MKLSPRPLALIVLGLLVGSSSAVAGPQERGQERPYDPPVVQFDADGIGLLEAVELTLENDPNIKIEEATTSFQEGILQESTGLFDAALFTNLSYQYRQQELRDSVREQEQEKRDNLREGIEQGEEFEQQVGDEIEDLDNALENPATIGNFSLPSDPVLEAQIRFIDELILQAQAEGTPVQELIDLRNDLIRERLAELRDALQATLDGLERSRQELENLGPTPDDEVLQNSQVRIGGRKLFRPGLQVSPFFEGNWDSNRYKGKPAAAEFGGKGIEDLFTFRLGFQVVLPLARGAGATSVAAAERAARFDLEASRYSLEHRSSVSVLQTVLAYWDLRAAQERIDVAERSVELQENLLDVNEALIEAGEQPGAERARVQASLASSRARLENSRQALHRARVRMAETMGLAVDETADSLPLAQDPFPGTPGEMLDVADVVQLAEQAVDVRRDLLAARSLQESGRVLVRGAEIDTRPLLDVTASSWYTALAEADVSEAVERWVGPSLDLAVDFELPFGNNVREGRLAQRRADLRLRSIDAVDLERLIQIGVVREAQSLDEAVAAVQEAREAVDYYRQTIESEFELLRTGTSTLVDSIITEQQQTGALLELVSAQAELARLLAILRFESGTLISYDPATSVVTAASLTTVPGGSR